MTTNAWHADPPTCVSARISVVLYLEQRKCSEQNWQRKMKHFSHLVHFSVTLIVVEVRKQKWLKAPELGLLSYVCLHCLTCSETAGMSALERPTAQITSSCVVCNLRPHSASSAPNEHQQHRSPPKHQTNPIPPTAHSSRSKSTH